MAEKPSFTGINHVCVVVRDLEKTLKTYWGYGIGPWEIYSLDPSKVSDMIIHDQRVDYAMRLAQTKIGDVYLELIQPLDDNSHYAKFLEERGEGLHHVGLIIDSYHKAMAFFRSKGIGVLQGGKWGVESYSYLETEGSLGFIAEIDDKPNGYRSPPAEMNYP